MATHHQRELVRADQHGLEKFDSRSLTYKSHGEDTQFRFLECQSLGYVCGMKIGLVRRGYSASGGAEKFLRRFADGVKLRGHEPVFFVDDSWIAKEDAEVIHLDGSSPRAFANDLEKQRGACDQLLSLERVWSCDVYRAGDGVHRAWLERRKAMEPAWKSWTRGFSAKHRTMIELEASVVGDASRCGKVVVNSRMVADEIADYYPGRSSDDVELIYNGYDPVDLPEEMDRALDRAEVRRELGIAEGQPVVLFVGSGWERKGLRSLIDAFSDVKDSRALLLVAGKGRVDTRWKGMGRVKFLGARSDVPRLLMAADVFALPTYYDPFSNATLEAARHGLPVITTRSNGFHEVMEDGVHGSVVEAGDADAIRAGLDLWISRAGDGEVFQRCLANAKPYTVARNVDATLGWLLGERA